MCPCSSAPSRTSCGQSSDPDNGAHYDTLVHEAALGQGFAKGVALSVPFPWHCMEERVADRSLMSLRSTYSGGGNGARQANHSHCCATFASVAALLRFFNVRLTGTGALVRNSGILIEIRHFDSRRIASMEGLHQWDCITDA